MWLKNIVRERCARNDWIAIAYSGFVQNNWLWLLWLLFCENCVGIQKILLSPLIFQHSFYLIFLWVINHNPARLLWIFTVSTFMDFLCCCAHCNWHFFFLCRYAAVFAAFVAGMACLVGMDFGAKFMASFAKCFEV